MAGSRRDCSPFCVLERQQKARLEVLEVDDLQFDVIPAEWPQRVCLKIEANQDACDVQQVQSRDEAV